MKRKFVIAKKLKSRINSALEGDIARKAIGLSAFAGAGQLVFVLALPLLSRLFTPADFGIFTIYLSIVNICGPLVGLKFDSALFATKSRSEAKAALALSFMAISVMTILVIAFAIALGVVLPNRSNQSVVTLLTIAPVGIFMAGAWSSCTAWAVRSDAIRTLAIARFLQPAGMTLIQLVCGLAGLKGPSLIVAHLLSHLGYAGFILVRTLTWRDVRQIVALPASTLLRRARDDVKFPLYVMPAQLSALTVVNLPPVVIAWLFGAEMAGQYGVAYRVIAAPLSIISLALSNVFTAEISRHRNSERLESVGRAMFLASLVFIAAPMLLFGFVAPEFARVLLGDNWIVTGQMASALALMGAAKALAAPFSEITSIYHYQALRFTTAIVSLVLVFAPLGLAAVHNWSVIFTIWGTSCGDALGSLVSLAAVCLILRRTRSGSASAEIAVAAATADRLL